MHFQDYVLIKRLAFPDLQGISRYHANMKSAFLCFLKSLLFLLFEVSKRVEVKNRRLNISEALITTNMRAFDSWKVKT